MRLLILSNRPAPAWLHALGSEGGVVVGDGEPLPAVGGLDAVLLIGAPGPRPADELAAVRRAVEAGTPLVAVGAEVADGFWSELLGVRSGDEVPAGEYFARVRGGDGGLTVRLEPEFTVVDRFRPLVAVDAVATVVDASIGFRDVVLVSAVRRGAGRVVTCALGTDVPAVATLVGRALRPEVPPPSRPLGVAIVGYGPHGGMGWHHGRGLTATEGLELVAVVDPSDERRKAAGDDFPGGLAAYASVDDLLGDPDVDLAIVATPPSAHFGLVRQLLRAGRHVACEKPLCLTAAEADELIDTAAANERVLTVHQNRRWDPDFLAVRRAVDAGLLGALFNVETFVGGFEHPCRAWHSDVQVSGGAVYDWGSHHVDWILQLLGSAPARVTTHGHKRVWHDVTNLDQLRLHLAWDDGREAEFFQSDVAAVRRPKFFVQGTAGTLVGEYRPLTFERIEAGRGYVVEQPHHAEAPATLTLARYESGYGLTSTALPVAPAQPYPFHRNLADHLHLGEPLAVTAESVRSVVAVLEASQRSSDEGGRVIEL